MKPASRGVVKKRKRDIPLSPESAKKGKVHAQRKFAQGSGPSGFSCSAAFALRERELRETNDRRCRNEVGAKTPLLTNRVPTTSQFVDFLCLGRTSLLHPSLHYLREASLATTSSTPAESPLPEKKDEGEVKDVVASEPKVSEALRKKYQEQRIAKQKSTSVTKLAQKVKGKVMVRTRSAVKKDDALNEQKNVKPVIALRSGLLRGQKFDSINAKGKGQKQLQRVKLRSGTQLENPKIVAKDSSKLQNTKLETKGKTTKVVKKGKSSDVTSKSPGEISSDDEPLMTKKPRLHSKNETVRTRAKASENEQAKANEETGKSRTSTSSKRKSRSDKPSSSPESTKKSLQKPSDKVKGEVKEENSPSRRSTRSTPSGEQPEPSPSKETSKDVIQKKKQNSPQTLSRFKAKPEKILVKSKVKKSEGKSEIEGNKNDSRPGRKLRGREIIEKTVEEEKNSDEEDSKKAPPKRPVRKCSTVDKMWIDVEGFTSDEDDFIDMKSIIIASKNSDSKKPESNIKRTPSGKSTAENDADVTETKAELVSSSQPVTTLKEPEPTVPLVTVKSSETKDDVLSSPPETLAALRSEIEAEKKALPKESEELKKDSPKSAFSTLNPTLFPRTAAWLSAHEKREAGQEDRKDAISGESNFTEPVENSHSLIARLATNNAAMKKPLSKCDIKPVIKDNKGFLPISRLDDGKLQKTEISPEVKPKKNSDYKLHASPLFGSSSEKSDLISYPVMKRENVSPVPGEKSQSKPSDGPSCTPEKVENKTEIKPSPVFLSKMPGSQRGIAYTDMRRQIMKAKETERKRILIDSSEESDTSSEKLVRRKRTRRPSPRAEVVPRKERPKRQCSSMGKSWVERDSDESSFYENEQDVMELIRRSEAAQKLREGRNSSKSDAFSESDDEPLLKKNPFSPSVSSLVTTDTREAVGNSKVPYDALSLGSVSSPFPPPAVTFQTFPRVPINTHGLDLLSEVVAVADKSTDRIEQWLKESIRADAGKGFLGFDETDLRCSPVAPVPNSNIPDPVLQFVRTPSTPPKSEFSGSPVRKVTPKEESALKRPPVSSVSDLIKLQRERKGSPKPTPEHHSKNCQCNNCVVRKGWFKNKPAPDEAKTDESKESTPSKSSSPGSPGKVSVSVAPIVQPEPVTAKRKSFLERMRDRERRETLIKPQLPPFSPSDESSVYAFEPEVEKQSKRTSTVTLPIPVKRSANTSVSQVDLATHLSASIAVQVNLDTGTSTEPVIQDDGKSMEISTQTEGADEDPDSQMFYIPLQQSAGTDSEQPVIQGVAVKLGTEGPVGPNQKVVMQAKIVTRPPITSQAVVRPQQKASDKSKMNPPVGTVQPTTRRPPAPARPRASVSPSSSKSSQSRTKKSPSPSLRVESASASTLTRRVTRESPRDQPTTASAAAAERTDESSLVVEAPTFYLTEKEFQDPLEFFDRIRPAAERFGICRIVPPSSFKPDCKVADDMRFTAYNQYVHRMFDRWGPSIKETMAMKKYLKTQRISLKPPPCVGGVEVDLPRLYQAVQTCGGLMKVMEKEKWQQVADLLRVPKAAHDRATKLDAIYCQYLLPYDTLKDDERKKLLDEVEADWTAHQEKIGVESQAESDEEEEENYIEECEECIVKGKNMALNQFYRIARNTMSMWFQSAEPDPSEVEAEFWRLVTEKKQHVCVHSGSIDSSGWGYGFPVGKNTFAKHPWNLKVLTNNSGSVLRSLGPVMGVTVPTLHVGMVFAAFCWYRDPHGLPWVEYLHTGAPKIWYGIADNNSSVFREALTKLMPKHIKDQRIWLPCDTAMVPPERLAGMGVPLSRTTQQPGQFVVVFPRAFTSSLCTGYLVSESVYFARPSWLQTAEEAFCDIHSSAEPSVFSLDNLLISIATDSRASLELLKLVLPMVQRVREREETGRSAIKELGVPEEPLPREKRRRRGRSQDPEPEHECDVCRASLFLSMVSCAAEEAVYCLKHGLQHLNEHGDQIQGAKLLYVQTQSEINEVVEKLEERISSKTAKNKK